PAEEGGRLGRNLPRLRVRCLAPADDEVDVAFLLDRERQRARRRKRVRDREHAVGQVDAAVGAEGEARAERCLGLRRSHRHRNHLGCAERDRVGDRRRVEGIQQQRHAFAPQLFRLLVELDRVGARNLLDQADDLHVWEPRRGRVLAILYDIHGNLVALDAVLQDAERAGADAYLLGGDFASWSPWPLETIERLRALPETTWIRGNGERWLREPPLDRPDVASEPAEADSGPGPEAGWPYSLQVQVE